MGVTPPTTVLDAGGKSPAFATTVTLRGLAAKLGDQLAEYTPPCGSEALSDKGKSPLEKLATTLAPATGVPVNPVAPKVAPTKHAKEVTGG